MQRGVYDMDVTVVIKPNYAELLSILEKRRTGMESSQVHKIAHDNPKTLLGDVTAISQMLWQCKDTGRVVAEKRDGVIFNKITIKGIEDLAEFNGAQNMKDEKPLIENELVLIKIVKIKALKAEAKKLVEDAKRLAAELVDDLLAME